MVNKKFSLLAVIILLLIFQNSESRKIKTDSNDKIPPDVKMLIYRVSNYVILEQDLSFIKNKINMFFEVDYLNENPFYNNSLLVFKDAMEKIPLPIESINLINKYAIALSGFEINSIESEHIHDIIWWAEARGIKDIEKLKLFLANQMASKNWRKSLSLFIERGMTDEIIKFSDLIETEGSGEQLLELSLRKAKFKKSLINNGKNFKDKIIKEINQSIIDVMPIIKKRGASRYDHLKWLIKQLGVFRENQEIKQILINLAADGLYYSIDRFKSEPFIGFSKSEIIELKVLTEERLIISQRAKEALNPTIIVEMDVMERGSFR